MMMMMMTMTMMIGKIVPTDQQQQQQQQQQHKIRSRRRRTATTLNCFSECVIPLLVLLSLAALTHRTSQTSSSSRSLLVGATDIVFDDNSFDDVIDIPFKNWTAGLSSSSSSSCCCGGHVATTPPLLSPCYPPVPELFRVRNDNESSSLVKPSSRPQQQQPPPKKKQEVVGPTTRTTTKTPATTTTGCHRIQNPTHDVMIRIPKRLEYKYRYATGTKNGEEEEEEEEKLSAEKATVVQQLLVIDLPNYIVKNRGQNFNVDVDYQTGRVVVEGYGYIIKNNLRGEQKRPSSRPSSSSSISSKGRGQQQQRKYCLYQEFVVDESMLLPMPSSSSAAAASSASTSTSIWDMTMEMNWKDSQLTLSLPVTIPSTITPSSPLSEQIVAEINRYEEEEQQDKPPLRTSESSSRNVRDYNSDNIAMIERDDDDNYNGLNTKSDDDDDHVTDDPILRELGTSINNDSADDDGDDDDEHMMLRGNRSGMTRRDNATVATATKVCGLARLSNTAYRHTPPCSTTSTTLTKSETSKKNTKSTFGMTFSIQNDEQSNVTTEKSDEQHDAHGYHNEHDYVQQPLSLQLSSSTSDDDGDSIQNTRIQSRQDALERFLAFSLGRDEEESYWLRRM